MRGTREALRVSGALAALARASLASSRLACARSGVPSVFALDAGRAISTCPRGELSRAHSRYRFHRPTDDDRPPPRSPASPASSGPRARVRSFHAGPSLGFAAAKLRTSAKKAKAEAKEAKEAKEADPVDETKRDKNKNATGATTSSAPLEYADDRQRLFGASRAFDLDAQNDARAMRAVNVAVKANTLIFFTKLGAYGVTGSSVMLAEAVHSAADILNQSLLWLGIRSSNKAPDENYNYGYRRERFVWSLISAVGVFFAGSGVSVAHGVHTLLATDAQVEHIGVGIGVLAASAAVDAYSLRVAYGALRDNAAARSMSLTDFVRAGHDPTSVAVVAEDAAAVAGCGVATAALLAAHVTGNMAYDAFGSIAVGGVLGLTATYLINSNRLLLLGRSLGDEKMRRVTDAIRSDPVVTEVYRAKSEELGPGSYRFVAEIEFSGAKVVERYLRSGDGAKRRQLHALFRDAAREMESAEPIENGRGASLSFADEDRACAGMDAALRLYGEEVVTAVGDEVDRMEKTIVGVEPTIHYVDLETN